MPGFMSIVMQLIRTTILTSKGNWSGAPFSYFFIIHPRKKNLNENDVEFELSIGHALVLFQFF